MLLRFYGVNELPTTRELMERASQQGLFSEAGLVYNRLNPFLKTWGFKAVPHRFLWNRRIKRWIQKDIPIIVSLKGEESGHLVVVCGIDSDKNIHILDPGSPDNHNQTLDRKTWNQRFNHRGFTLEKIT